MSKHFLCSLEIGNYTTDQGRFNNYITALAAGHFGGLRAEGDDLICHLIYCHERWFVEDHTTALDGDDRARRSKVDRYRIGNQFF